MATAPTDNCCSHKGILLVVTGVESNAIITGAWRGKASIASISSLPASGRARV